MSGVIDQVKEKIDIVELIQAAGVQLKRTGRNYVGFCPFHSNTRTPAFTVYPETQSYHCFGCKASGTAFDFVMRREGLEFKDALEQLARRAGVQLEERTQADVQQDQRRTRLLEVNAAAAAFFHHVLVKSRRGEDARAYVARRAISDETIESFQLGYAVDDWSALLSYLSDRRGFEPEEIEAAGLAIRRDSGGFYDRFRGRLMFPIRSPKGEVIAFGGRALGDAQPKYMNSPQTPLFDKGKVLYGYDLARDAIRSAEAAVIVEGYVDVIIAHQHGFRDVVAPLGTALTHDHVDMLRRVAKRVYLALDADPAGVRAALKGAQTIQQIEGAAGAHVGANLWGTVQLQSDVELRVLSLPDGKDPDEVIQASPETWRQAVAQARPAMEFYIGALTADLDLASAPGKSEAVARLAPLLAQVANPVEHAHYTAAIARALDIREEVILRALPRGQGGQPGQAADRQRPGRGGPPPRQQPEPAKAAAPAPARGSVQEEHLLCWLMRYPTTKDAVQEKIRRDLEAFPIVQEMISDSVAALFERTEHRAVFELWDEAPANTNPDQWAEGLDEPLRGVALQVLRLRPPSQVYRYVNDALECATILQQQQARRWLSQMKKQADSDSDPVENDQAGDYLTQIIEYLGAISAPRRSSTYADLHTLHTV